MRTIRIFISSPGDVSEEREKARLVVESLRRVYGNEIRLDILMWEDLALDIDLSAQQSIEKELVPEDKVPDIAVFILWSRLGSELSESATPRPDGGSYRSGTEHEFELMLGARETSGGAKPQILAYWRQDEEGFVELLRREGPGRYEEMLEQKRLARHFIEERFMDEKGRNVRGLVIYQKPVSFAERLRSHLVQKIDSILGRDAGPTSSRWTDRPYRGLEVFDQEHAAIFHGREEETHAVIDRLRKRAGEDCACVIIVGASGSGKSSLARAGVAATLTRHSFEDEFGPWRTTVLLPSLLGGDVFHGLAQGLAGAAPELEAGTGGLSRFENRLKTNPAAAADLLASALERAGGQPGRPARLLLILDQMEELWSDPRVDPDSREGFLGALHALSTEGNLWIVATLRSDFYAEAQLSPAFLRLKGSQGHFDLAPPGPHALQRIISEPAHLAGLRFETEARTGRTLDRVVLEDAAGETEILPLLQYALAELYERRDRDSGLLTHAAYEQMGGVEGALGRRIEEICQALPPGSSAALEEIFPLLVTLDPSGGGGEARRRARLRDLTEGSARADLTEALIRDRFLTTDEERGEAVVGLAHEALLRCWNRLTGWIAENRELLRLRSGVEPSHSRWEQHGRDPSFLLPAGLALEEGRNLLEEGAHLLRDDLVGYIRESIRYQEEQSRRRAALRRRFRIAIGSSLVFGLIASTWQAVRATRAERSSEIHERASRARVLSESSPLEALALSIDTVQEESRLREESVSPAVLSSLLHTLETGRRIEQFKSSEPVADCLLTPDGRFIVRSGSTKLTTVDRRTGLSRTSSPTKEIRIRRIAGSGDGDITWLADDDGNVTAVKTTNHEVLWRVKAHEGFATGLAWAEDPQILASCGSDRRLRFWTTEGKEAAPAVALPLDSVVAFAISSDGKTAAVAAPELHAGQGVWLVDCSTGEVRPLEVGDDVIRAFSFDASGERLAGAGLERTIRFWNRNGEPTGQRIRSSHAATITALAFHPVEGWLLAGAENGVVHAYLENGEKPFAPLEPHTGEIRRVAFNATGSLAISGSQDGSVRTWDILGLQAVSPFPAGVLCRGLAFNSDGSRLAGGGMDGVVRIFTYPSGELKREVRAHRSLCDQLLALPDGRGLLSASDTANELVLLDWEGEPLAPPWQAPGGAYLALHAFGNRSELLVLSRNGLLYRLALPSFEILAESRIAGDQELSGDYQDFAALPEQSCLIFRGPDYLEKRSLENPSVVLERRPNLRNSSGTRYRLVLPPERNLVLTSGPAAQGRIPSSLFSIPGLEPIHEINTAWTISTIAAFTREGSEVAIGSETGVMQFYALSGEPIGPEIRAHVGDTRGFATHPDEEILATSGEDGWIRFWHFGKNAWMKEAAARLGRGSAGEAEPLPILHRAASNLLTGGVSDGTGKIHFPEAGLSLHLTEGWARFDPNALKMIQSLIVSTGGTIYNRMRVLGGFSRGNTVRIGIVDVPNFYLVSANEMAGTRTIATQLPQLTTRIGEMIRGRARDLTAASEVEFSEVAWDANLRCYRLDGIASRPGRAPLVIGCWLIPTNERLVAVITMGEPSLLREVEAVVAGIELDPAVAPSPEEYGQAAQWLAEAFANERQQKKMKEDYDADLKRLGELAGIMGKAGEAGNPEATDQAFEEALRIARTWTEGRDFAVVGAARFATILDRSLYLSARRAEIHLNAKAYEQAEAVATSALDHSEKRTREIPERSRPAIDEKEAWLTNLVSKARSGQGNLDEAIAWQERSVEKRRIPVTAGIGEPNSHLNLCTALSFLAELQKKKGETGKAVASLEEAIRVLESVPEQARTESWLLRARDQFGALRGLHQIAGEPELEFKTAGQQLDRILEWNESHAPTRATRWAVLESHLACALLDYKRGAAEEARAGISAAFAEMDSLLPEETDGGRIDKSGENSLSPLWSHLQKESPREATAILEKMIELRSRGERLPGWTTDLNRTSASGYVTLGAHFNVLGESEAADAAFAKALERATEPGSNLILYDTHNRLRGHFASRREWDRALVHAEAAFEATRKEDLGWRMVEGTNGLVICLYELKRFAEAEPIALAAWEAVDKTKWPGEPRRLRHDLANHTKELYRRWNEAAPDPAKAEKSEIFAERQYLHSPLEEPISDGDLSSFLMGRLWRMATWIEQGKLEEYRLERSRVLAIARDRHNSSVAHNAARLALLLPEGKEDLDLAARLATRAYELQGREKAPFWETYLHALALLRTGHPDETMRLCEAIKPGGSRIEKPCLEALKALAFAATGRQAEAREVLNAIEGDFSLMNYLNGPGDPYTAFARVLLSEARGLREE